MNVSGAHRSVALSLGVLALGLLFSLPSHAAAQTASINTEELLPPGQNTCQQMAVTSVQSYVYGGVLESFDVTISDNSDAYVGILSTVGDTPISLGSMTRWAGEPSGLLIHVDTPDTPVGSGLPVKLTLMASLPGQPTCMTTVSFYVAGASVAPTTSSATIPVIPSTSSTGPSSAAGGTSPVATSEGAAQSAGVGSSTQNASSTALLGASVAAANSGSVINGICSGNNVYRLWFILLAIYVVIVAVVVFAEPWFIEDSVLGSTAAILVPLIALLAFWYFSAACRGASWIPVVACVIAILGLFLAFREYETTPLLAAPSET